jgi:hypothetical protein
MWNFKRLSVWMPAVRRLWAIAMATALVGCSSKKAPSDAPDAAVVHITSATIEDAGFVSAATELGATGVDAGGARPLTQGAAIAKSIDVPAGTFATGSTPGDEGRVAAIEPALVPVSLGAYAIDALPYPNDPATVPALVSSQAAAEAACAERGARLCTELEWEHACKGPSGDAFSTGAAWNDACARAPSQCASGFGARAMSFLPEWTASRFEDGPVLRGGPASGHRCAARVHASNMRSAREGGRHTEGTPQKMPSQAAFRCCHGAQNEAVVAPIEPKPPFRKTTINADDLAAIFGQSPQLARLGEGVKLFTDDGVKTILSRSGATADGITFATSPILWSPEPGVELLVATGRAKKTGFVVALWTVPGASGKTEYRLASSFLLLNDPSPVALAYEPWHKKELRWTTCWGCAGEQGGVSIRDDGRVVIVQY